MLPIDDLRKLMQRLQRGREMIEGYPQGWSGGTTPPFDAKDRYGKNMERWRTHKRECPKGLQDCDCGLTALQQLLCNYWELDEVFWDNYKKHNELRREKPKEVKHSKVWNIMQRNKAIEKWKHTLKAKRGPDPRLLPLETFI